MMVRMGRISNRFGQCRPVAIEYPSDVSDSALAGGVAAQHAAERIAQLLEHDWPALAEAI